MPVRVSLTALLLWLTPIPAWADLTAFIGVTPTPVNRPARGFALGVSLLFVGFEVEYSDTAEEASNTAPSLRTGMFNGLVQSPLPLGGVQFYATAGLGLYRERQGADQHTNLAGNVGGGVKLTLAGPLRLRLDYRVFTLRGPARVSKPQRIYAGLNLRF